MSQPSTQMWLEISNTFETFANFSNGIGVIDGKHIKNQCHTYVIVGNEAFGLSENIMQLYYDGKNLTVTKKKFKYWLSRARKYIKCSDFSLTVKWLNVKLDLAQNIIKDCCILHNIVMYKKITKYTLTMRDKFVNYFITDGKIEWQYRTI
ncbi:protein ALP1-like [Aphis craccivora]|uniref:Protein ALP1-like n=1 Tax=Aphis craccivora TaxID=307492 RepID=A0A6G0ZCE8_APHCR|nr:protein ALP1-like [Aphis craccivora]